MEIEKHITLRERLKLCYIILRKKKHDFAVLFSRERGVKEGDTLRVGEFTCEFKLMS